MEEKYPEKKKNIRKRKKVSGKEKKYPGKKA